MVAPKTKIIIPPPDLRVLNCNIEGLSPLLVSRWSEKATRQITESQSGAPKTRKRAARDPEAEFKASLYEYPGGGYGFPCAAFRLAAVSACRLVDGLTMTQARLLFVIPDDLAKLTGAKPKMDTRPVRLANGSADLRYRGIFWPWATKLSVRYNAGAVSAEQLLNLLILAGECIGVGELRPERGGNYGRFTIK
jgi:hypothetical protein